MTSPLRWNNSAPMRRRLSDEMHLRPRWDLDDAMLCSTLDALPFSFQDDLREPRDVLYVRFRPGVVRFLRLESLECRFDGPIEVLLICLRRVDEQPDPPLDEHDPLDLV